MQRGSCVINAACTTVQLESAALFGQKFWFHHVQNKHTSICLRWCSLTMQPHSSLSHGQVQIQRIKKTSCPGQLKSAFVLSGEVETKILHCCYNAVLSMLPGRNTWSCCGATAFSRFSRAKVLAQVVCHGLVTHRWVLRSPVRKWGLWDCFASCGQVLQLLLAPVRDPFCRFLVWKQCPRSPLVRGAMVSKRCWVGTWFTLVTVLW